MIIQAPFSAEAFASRALIGEEGCYRTGMINDVQRYPVATARALPDSQYVINS